MFDIEKLDTRTRSEAGVAMTVRNPSTMAPFRDADGKEVTITFYGRNSKAFRDAQREAVERRTTREAHGVVANEEELRQDLADFLTPLTVSWSDNIARGGQKLAATPENIHAFWSDDRWSWVARQAEQFIMAEGNFLAN